MTISSRTVEGIPHRCPICGKVSSVEPSCPGGDSCCPSCYQWLRWFREHLSRITGIAPERITLSSSFTEDIRTDSLDLVELVMELEGEVEIPIPDAKAERIKTVADAIRYLQKYLKK